MGGKASRDKGNRTERNLVNWLNENGIPAERVPLSGACRGSFGGDILLKDTGHKIEVKCRANGFKTLYDWLDGNDFLIVKADRKPSLVVMDMEKFKEFYNAFRDVHGVAFSSGSVDDA